MWNCPKSYCVHWPLDTSVNCIIIIAFVESEARGEDRRELCKSSEWITESIPSLKSWWRVVWHRRGRHRCPGARPLWWRSFHLCQFQVRPPYYQHVLQALTTAWFWVPKRRKLSMYVRPPNARTEMYAGRIACCPLVSDVEYAPPVILINVGK